MLSEGGVLAQPLLYLSSCFKGHRDEYYRLLDAVRHGGDAAYQMISRTEQNSDFEISKESLIN